ncbi:hypothetical protein FSP39_022886 [Pinctada imbricata]|uniref:Uncharacterized protein n=1 Tax=Pinctada imbricata TaxID=66713 RepID=A0AA88Y3R6_PINIB|nr:hypothetical protein FSP39_022886 [Pinctada imbricata]
MEEQESLLRNSHHQDDDDARVLDNSTKQKKDGIKFAGDKLLVVACILLCELCERLTYYSVVANLVLFCTSKLKLSSSDASSVSLVFSGTVYIIPVFGGYISDAFAGKYNTILGSGLIYLLGLFLLPASAVDYENWFGDDAENLPYNLSVSMRKTYFFLGLVFVAIGTGGIKANVGPFGAQQVDDLGPEAVQTFFNWFYWFINAGSFIAYVGVAYIQQNISFALGFLIPLLSMIVSLIVFVAVRSKYHHVEPGGSILKDSIGVCLATRCRGFRSVRGSYGGPYSDEMVDGVISVLRVIPVFLLVILFWAIYSQMQSTFFLQGERMDVDIGDTKMPVAALNVFNTIIIMLTIPLMDRVVYPVLKKYDRSPTLLQRIGVGFILAGLSVVVAGVVEIYRKDILSEKGGISQDLGDETFNASTLTVFAQIPQFACVGAGEVFASIAGLEFAYSQAPEFMQGLVMGLFLMTSGLGSYVSEAILKIVRAATGTQPPDSWYPDEINDGKVEYLFFLLAGLMALNLVIFIVIAKFYKYREEEPEVDYGVWKDNQLKQDIEGVRIDPTSPPLRMANPAFQHEP